jgi:hypothetical protein
MRPLILLTISLFFCYAYGSQLFAQEAPRLKLKLGASKLIHPPGYKQGYAFRAAAPYSPYPLLGIEYSKVLRNQNRRLITGLSLEPTGAEFTLNDDNINPGPIGRSFVRIGYQLESFVGLENTIRFNKKRTQLGNRNYFSWAAGFGLSINGGNAEKNHVSRFDPPFSGIYAESGSTKDGRIYKGWENYTQAGFPVSPFLFSSLRWHIRNKSKRDIVQVELQIQYCLTRHFSYYYRYSLNDIQHTDKLAEKGFNAQLSVLIPIKTFKERM